MYNGFIRHIQGVRPEGSDCVKAAILGAGFIAEYHALGYQEAEDISLCAVCDTDKEKARALAQRYGCAWYTDAKTLLEKERPQLVSVCLPTHLHREYVCMALAAGAPLHIRACRLRCAFIAALSPKSKPAARCPQDIRSPRSLPHSIPNPRSTTVSARRSASSAAQRQIRPSCFTMAAAFELCL